MKQKLLSGFLGSVVLTAFLAPSALAASETFYWNFDMDLRAVYGDQNGQYMSFSKSGDKTVSGSIWADVKGTTPTPAKINVAAWRDTLGPDTLAGETSMQPSKTLESKTSFELPLGIEPADQYYLRFEKYGSSDDGWDLKGSGKFENTY